jgi:hypothetical protein
VDTRLNKKKKDIRVSATHYHLAMNMEEVDTYFDIFDYIVFAAMLIVSSWIGIYFAFFAKIKQNTTSQYLMGGKTMGIFPISMSLIAR